MMQKFILPFFSLIVILTLVESCKKDAIVAAAETGLYNEIKSPTGYTYFQNGSTLPGVSPSPHGAFKLRINAIGQTVLDQTGRLPVGKSFPNGSVIVKEVLAAGTNNINIYAVMKKDPTNSNMGSGWLWAEYKADGTEISSVGNKGSGCISCHSGSPNRDLTRTFDLH